MLSADTVLYHELPVIRKIIEDETWLEGERRGCPVSPADRVVRERVCTIVLLIGHDLREAITRRLPPGADAMLPASTIDSPDAGLTWEI
jgi:hypothetical protein